jgi:4-methyl-5(b-hydroxyethyl)-thiazole monophosphate biosynthesis
MACALFLWRMRLRERVFLHFHGRRRGVALFKSDKEGLPLRNVLFVAYPEYADFEVAHALFMLKKVGKSSITTVTVDGKPVKSLGGLTTEAQQSCSNVSVQDYDLVLLSGGDGVNAVWEDRGLSDLLQNAHRRRVPIASICASALLLAKAGVLDGKEFTCLPHTYEYHKDVFRGAQYTGADVKRDGTIITAKGIAYADFTMAVGDILGVFRDDIQRKKLQGFVLGKNV